MLNASALKSIRRSQNMERYMNIIGRSIKVLSFMYILFKWLRTEHSKLLAKQQATK